MIDDDIRTHIQTRMIEAYSGITVGNMVIKIGDPVDFEQSHRQGIAYQETINVLVVITAETNLERGLAIVKFLISLVTLGSIKAIQRLIRCRQSDYVEGVGIKQILFELTYTYDVPEA